jgi:hypothetical protein
MFVVRVLRDLPRDEDEVARAHRRMKRQVRVLLADRIDIGGGFLRNVRHGCGLYENALVSMMSTPDAVDQIDQPAVVDRHVVRRRPVGARAPGRA